MGKKICRLRLNIALVYCAVLTVLILPLVGFAQGEAQESQYQNPFADYVPFEDEYDVDEDERFMYFGRFFAVGLGTGAQTFGGNIGKLYNTSLPTFHFNLLYFFDFRFAGQLHFSSASHAFSASPNGFVEVTLLQIAADLKYYFDTKDLSATVTAANPYIIAGVGNTFRSQIFQDFGTTEKDTALTLSAGLGVEFALKPRKISLGAEFRIHQLFFKDRFSQEYLISDIPDTSGALYSFTTNLMFFF